MNAMTAISADRTFIDRIFGASSPANKTIALAAPGRASVRASLSLDFARDSRSGRTSLAASSEEPPLRVVRAFAREDGSALAHLHNVSGGLLGGDELHLSVSAGPGSAVQLTTTGAARIYRPRAESAPSSQLTEIRVAEDALVEYVPDAIIPFADARFFQRTQIHLAPGASLFWWEILAPGREARGELFEYASVEMRAEIFTAGRPIATESFLLEPRLRAPQSPARLGPFRYAASFYVCRVGPPAVAGLPAGAGPAPSAWAEAEAHLRREAAALASPGTLWGVSTLVEHGLVIRCLAREGHGVLAGLHTMWRAAKLHLLGRAAIPPRKVY